MFFKILTILTIISIAKCHDVIVGHNEGGRKIFDDKRVASPAIWRQTENVTINATEGEVISRVVVTDLRPEKDGDVRILEGGEGQKSVTIELKSPTVLRGFEFKIEAYASPEQNHDTTVKAEMEHPSQIRNQRNLKQPSNTDYSLRTITESSSKNPDMTKSTETKENEKPTQDITTESITYDTFRMPVLNDQDSKDISPSTLEQGKTSGYNVVTTTIVSTPKILGDENNTDIPKLDFNKDQSRYSRDTQDQSDEDKKNNETPSLVPKFVSTNTESNSDSSTGTTNKNSEYGSELSASKDANKNSVNIPLILGLNSNSEIEPTYSETENKSKANNDNAPPTYKKDGTYQFSKNVKTDNTRTVRNTETDTPGEPLNVSKSLSDQNIDNSEKTIYDSTIEPEYSSTLLRGLISSTDKSEIKSFEYSTKLTDEKTRISRDTDNESKGQKDNGSPQLPVENYESKLGTNDETTMNPEEMYTASVKSFNTGNSFTDIPRNVRQVEENSKDSDNSEKQESEHSTQNTSPSTFRSDMDTVRISTPTITANTTDAVYDATTNKNIKIFPKSISSDSSIQI